MQDRSNFLTELPNPASEFLDSLSVEDQVKLMHQQDLQAANAVGEVGPAIAAAVKIVTERLRLGGRLLYVGAGTSGRLGVLDASEIPPTFRADPELVQGIIAGGIPAIFKAQEGAEDDASGGERDLVAKNLTSKDVVFGITAGGSTPYVHGALRYAKTVGSATIFLSCVAHSPGETEVDVVIRPLTGPEIVTGSTRLKAGTATKLVLNTVTTLAMVGLGKTYGNWMVDVQASNAKLRDRAARIVQTLTATTRPRAEELLALAGGHAKVAITMHKLNATAETAKVALGAAGGSLRKATEK